MASEGAPACALVGVGYMGGSLALAARAAGIVGRVVGYDPDPSALEQARARGVIDASAASAPDAVHGAKVVLLCGPVRTLGETGAAIKEALVPDALVVDIGSVKAPVVAALEACLGAHRFVGCHPLAGTEAVGVGSAVADLFRGKPCFLCPGGDANPAIVARAAAFWSAVGSHVVSLDPVAHDAFMASASHLPHVAAFALAGSLREEADDILARMPTGASPTSLRDTTRIAASSPAVWRDIFLANRTHLLPLVRQLEARMGDLRAAIETGDEQALERHLASARVVRRKLFPA